MKGFGALNILGLLFILMGAVLLLILLNINLPFDLSRVQTTMEFGAAVGSIIGGFFLLIRSSGSSSSMPDVKIK